MNKANTLPLAEYLKRERITQVEFARRLDVAPNTVHRWIACNRRPGWTAMAKIIEATGGAVTPDSFLSDRSRNECRAA
jgi:DNA-binding transcriptional regulator YdaS (Cro superfamily)